MLERVFRVSEMHCPNCAMRLESLEDELPGIQAIRASYRKGRMQVIFDEQRVSSEQIIAAVQRKGYVASLLE